MKFSGKVWSHTKSIYPLMCMFLHVLDGYGCDRQYLTVVASTWCLRYTYSTTTRGCVSQVIALLSSQYLRSTNSLGIVKFAIAPRPCLWQNQNTAKKAGSAVTAVWHCWHYRIDSQLLIPCSSSRQTFWVQLHEILCMPDIQFESFSICNSTRLSDDTYLIVPTSTYISLICEICSIKIFKTIKYLKYFKRNKTLRAICCTSSWDGCGLWGHSLPTCCLTAFCSCNTHDCGLWNSRDKIHVQCIYGV